MQVQNLSDQIFSNTSESNTGHFTKDNLLAHKDLIGLILIVISSFLFDIWSLTRYSISYGIDGPFYNIQVQQIFTNFFPNSNDPPLVYYLMAFFSVFFGVMLGIKVTMALFSSLIAVPTYFIIKLYTDTFEKKTSVPALLGSFLMTFNIYYLDMIGEFMQNLVGVFFLLVFLFYLLHWIPNEELQVKNKDFVLMTIFFMLNFLTHIYTAGIAIFLVVMVLIYKLFVNYKTQGKIPVREIKILAGSTVLLIILSIVSFFLFPDMTADFDKIISFIDSFLGQGSGSFFSIMFLTIPFLGGLFFILKHMEIKNSRRSFSSFVFIMFSILLFCLSLPFISSNWSSRFMLLNFIPISMVSSIGVFGLYFINFDMLQTKIPSIKLKKAVIYTVSAIFILSALISMINFVPNMGPTITAENYQELVSIKTQLYGTTIKPGDTILVNDFGANYWYKLVFNDNNVEALGNIQNLNTASTKYFIITSVNTTSLLGSSNVQTWDFLLPMGLFTNSQSHSALNNPSNNNNNNNGPTLPNARQQQRQPINPSSPNGNSLPALQGYNESVIYQGSYFDVYQLT